MTSRAPAKQTGDRANAGSFLIGERVVAREHRQASVAADIVDHQRCSALRPQVDAQHWLDRVTATMMAGTHAGPQAGRITLAEFFGEWSARQVWVRGTVQDAAGGKVGAVRR